MFEHPFEFEGRIRRSEFGVSLIIYTVIATILNVIIQSSVSSGSSGAIILIVFYIPGLWFLWAQGAKRCHDLGNSGWFQLIPFYGLWMIFQDGEAGHNQYGFNPKGISVPNFNSNSFNTPTSNPSNTNIPGSPYQGGYDGGHNGNNTNQSYQQQSYTSSNPNNGSSEYRSGDLYK